MASKYVLFASTGEYSDKTEVAFLIVVTKRRAEQIIKKLDKIGRALRVSSGSAYSVSFYYAQVPEEK